MNQKLIKLLTIIILLTSTSCFSYRECRRASDCSINQNCSYQGICQIERGPPPINQYWYGSPRGTTISDCTCNYGSLYWENTIFTDSCYSGEALVTLCHEQLCCDWNDYYGCLSTPRSLICL